MVRWPAYASSATTATRNVSKVAARLGLASIRMDGRSDDLLKDREISPDDVGPGGMSENLAAWGASPHGAFHFSWRSVLKKGGF
jgi:hypothetical protein